MKFNTVIIVEKNNTTRKLVHVLSLYAFCIFKFLINSLKVPYNQTLQNAHLG